MSRSIAALATGASILALDPSSARAQCVTGGTGGFVPDLSIAVDGVWPSTLPTGELVTSLNVTVPGGVTVIHSVNFALKHTWGGDVQIVLESPSGVLYNIVQLNDGIFGGGCFSDFFGVYEVVDPIAGGLCSPVTGFLCGQATYASGSYTQEFGTWPSGSANIVNVPLEQIPLASGTWKLHLYDWYVFADNGALLNWEMCFGQPTVPPPPPPVTMQCATGGGGGTFPIGGSDGTWPSPLPTGELTAPLAVTVPSGATKVVAVKINSFTHTWYGDMQIVLQSPTGSKYNLVQTNDGIFAGGCGDDLNGDYVFVDANVGQNPCGGAAPAIPCGSGTVLPGTYLQAFGLWPSGSDGIDNTPLEQIPLASGTWNLICYDWYVGADDGTFLSWDLCFDLPGGPTAFCTAGTSSNGCVPSISANVDPSVTQATAPIISVASVEGQKFGIVFYGINQTGFTPAPWAIGSTSFLCVKGPTQRTGAVGSGGTTGLCDGVLSVNWNAFQTANPGSLGNPFSAGDKVYVQGWYRDPPAPKTTNLSNALELTMQP